MKAIGRKQLRTFRRKAVRVAAARERRLRKAGEREARGYLTVAGAM